MIISRLTYRIGETIPTENFANVKPEIELSVEVESGDDVEKVRAFIKAALVKELNAWKEQELSSLLKKPKPNMNNGGSWPQAKNPINVGIPTPVQAIAPNGGFTVGQPESDESLANLTSIPVVDKTVW